MDELISCLQDADCDSDFISEICRLYKGGHEKNVLQRLHRHRSVLMDEMHASQRKVDVWTFCCNSW